MLRLGKVNLDTNPSLIQPPQVEDNTVVIRLVADEQDIIAADIIDVALSYSIAGIDVILEMDYEDCAKFNFDQLASLICNGGWSLSLLPPTSSSIHPIDTEEYSALIIVWYQIWRSKTMRNFEKSIYPITPYLEYLTTIHLIQKESEELSDADKEELMALNENPNHPYLINLIDNMDTVFVESFKYQLGLFIQKNDSVFYKDIDLIVFNS